jgi:hypothetical protein
MQKLIFSILCVFITNLSFAQNYYTKQEMYQDFDELYNIVKSVCGQIEVKNKITNDDILAKIHQQRAKIKLINNSIEFIEFLDKCLSLVNDMHCGAITDSVVLVKILNNNAKSEKLIELINEYFRLPDKHKSLPIALYYYKGDYYSVGQFILSEESVNYDSLPLGSKIISINGIAIDSIVNFNINNGYSFYRWDNLLNKKYIIKQSIYIPSSFDTNVITYLLNDKSKDLSIKKGSKITISSNGYFYQSFMQQGFVEYFAENKILYIRLPKMANYDFYKEEILKKGKDVSIDKIVIDIRHNGGGSDEVFMQILETLIKNTIFVNANIGFKDNSKVITTLSNKYGKKNYKKKKNNLLDNKKYLMVNWGRNLVPDSNSINYNGKIYIMQDKFIFSAAGSLSNLAQLNDKLISVGENTGFLLGFGIAPFVFSLPNSGFSFAIEPAIDFTNVEKIYDFYHDNVEVPIEPTINAIVRYFNTEEKKLYSKDFLYNHDPVFQKVLELK